MFSHTAEYALRAVLCLAMQPERAKTTQEIARTTRVPSGYLSKVLQALGRAGLVSSQRGIHGGFIMAKPPTEVSILAVINAVSPFHRFSECPLHLRSHDSALCPLHRRLDESIQVVERSLSSCSIAQLLTEDTCSPALRERESAGPARRG